MNPRDLKLAYRFTRVMHKRSFSPKKIVYKGLSDLLEQTSQIHQTVLDSATLMVQDMELYHFTDGWVNRERFARWRERKTMLESKFTRKVI